MYSLLEIPFAANIYVGQVLLVEGQLTSDPELAYKAKGFPVCAFEIGVVRHSKEGEELLKEVCFFEIQTPGKQGERCTEKLSARSGVRVVGRLKEQRWTDDRGDEQRKVYVVAEHVEIKPEEKKLPDKLRCKSCGVGIEKGSFCEKCGAGLSKQNEQLQQTLFGGPS